ncbi:MAG: hypothetical protein SF069_13180 [Phycisphaerae bacterium]|nr:hypothetical protein [Phycisphaerae bacterium]
MIRLNAKVAVVLLVCIAASSVQVAAAREAWPPPTLGSIIGKARYAAHVRVESVRPSERGRADNAHATVRVLRVLTGDVKPGVVLTLKYDDTIACPEPEKFTVDEEQIVFIAQTSEAQPMRLACGRHGQIRGADASLAEAVAGHLSDYYKLVSESDPQRRKRLQIEWFITRLKDPRTRQSSLIELHAYSDADSFERFSRDEVLASHGDSATKARTRVAPIPLVLSTDLTSEEKQRVLTVLADEKNLNSSIKKELEQRLRGAPASRSR